MLLRFLRLPCVALLFLLSLTAPDVSADNETQAPRRPKVIVILSDDQGYGDLSIHGNPDINTPHLDALAQGDYRLTLRR